MNTKDKNYKEWLRLGEALEKVEWSYPTTWEYDEAWYAYYENPKFKKFNRWYGSVPKWYVNIFNRGDRRHNKNALKKNISMPDFDLEDNFIEYRYKSRNSAKWMWF